MKGKKRISLAFIVIAIEIMLIVFSASLPLLLLVTILRDIGMRI